MCNQGRCVNTQTPDVLTPAFVACMTNVGEGLVKLSCKVTLVDVWKCGTSVL